MKKKQKAQEELESVYSEGLGKSENFFVKQVGMDKAKTWCGRSNMILHRPQS